MEEADQLSDRVAIETTAGCWPSIPQPPAAKALRHRGRAAPRRDAEPASAGAIAATRAEAAGNTLRIFADRGGDVIPPLIHVAEQQGRQIRDIRLFPPSLETLFISLTGRTIE
jgi:hypothetical protein